MYVTHVSANGLYEVKVDNLSHALNRYFQIHSQDTRQALAFHLGHLLVTCVSLHVH